MGDNNSGYHLGLHIDALVRKMEVPTASESPIAGRVERRWNWLSTTFPWRRALVPTRNRHALVLVLATGIVDRGARQAFPVAILIEPHR